MPPADDLFRPSQSSSFSRFRLRFGAYVCYILVQSYPVSLSLLIAPGPVLDTKLSSRWQPIYVLPRGDFFVRASLYVCVHVPETRGRELRIAHSCAPETPFSSQHKRCRLGHPSVVQELTAFTDRSFTFKLSTPQTTWMLKRCAGIEKVGQSQRIQYFVTYKLLLRCMYVYQQFIEITTRPKIHTHYMHITIANPDGHDQRCWQRQRPTAESEQIGVFLFYFRTQVEDDEDDMCFVRRRHGAVGCMCSPSDRSFSHGCVNLCPSGLFEETDWCRFLWRCFFVFRGCSLFLFCAIVQISICMGINRVHNGDFGGSHISIFCRGPVIVELPPPSPIPPCPSSPRCVCVAGRV